MWGMARKNLPPCNSIGSSVWLMLLASCIVDTSVVSRHGQAAAPPTEVEFLDGLRERHLFQLAETYCRRRLLESELTPIERSNIVIELSRTRLERGQFVPSTERGTWFTDAISCLDDFLTKHPEHSRAILLRLQKALVLARYGRILREDVELQGVTRVENARRSVRDAQRFLESLADDVSRQTRLSHHSGGRSDHLSSDELFSVHAHVQFHLASVYIDQALLYPVKSTDRVNSLTRALRHFAPLAHTLTDTPRKWDSRLEQIRCHRLLGQRNKVEQLIQFLSAAEPPDWVLVQLRIERARQALNEGRPDKALQIVGGAARSKTDAHPLAVLIVIESLSRQLTLLKQNERAENSLGRLRQLSALVQELEDHHGLYWARRAELLMAKTIGRVANSTDTTLLLRSARSLFRQGNIAEALATYDGVARKAQQAGQTDIAFEAGLEAASIEFQSQNHEQAQARFQAISTQFPRHPMAANAHLTAVVAAAQIARQRPDTLNSYKQLIQEHLQHWPQGDSANKVRYWLGQLYQHDTQWASAIREFSAIDIWTDAVDYVDVLERTVHCYEAQLNSTQRNELSYAKTLQDGTSWLEQLARAFRQDRPDVADCAVVYACRLRLRFAEHGWKRVVHTLRELVPPLKKTAICFEIAGRCLVEAHIAMADIPSAKSLISDLANSKSADLLDLLDGMSMAAVHLSENDKKLVAQLQLELMKSLEPGVPDLPAVERKAFQQHQAKALVKTGEIRQAVDMYQLLVREYPQDGKLQTQFAVLLGDLDEDEYSLRALTQWRLVLKKSMPQSRRWFLAKYGIAQTFLRQGNPQKAAEIIKLTQLLYPELGGANLRQRFLELLSECES